MKKKVWVMIGAMLAAVVVAACGKSETYRSIMVYQINGNATITRDRVGEMEAYENLMLQSGDSVAVASESSLRLKLDDDKYILAEQDTLMNIVADGDDANAKTYIDLQQGSVTSEIQNKLKDGASYEVNTPNSIMAVRGTIFRVEVEIDENQNPNTKLTVLQGTVSARAVLPDGTISSEEVLVDAGNELTVEGMPTSIEDLGAPAQIDYESLPTIITDYIEELEQSGQELAAGTAQNAQQTQEKEQPQKKNARQQDADVNEQQQDSDAKAQEVDAADEPEQIKEAQNEADVKVEEDQPKTQKEQSETPKKSQEKPDAEPNPNPAPNPGPQEPSLGQPQQPDLQPQETEPPKVQPNPNPNPQGATSDGDQDQDAGKSSGGGSKKTTQYYTVTFQYNGTTFGTQKVKKGEKATEPKLCPTENGAWDYDFSKKVDKNLTIEWKAN